jgi:hypothetical protein
MRLAPIYRGLAELSRRSQCKFLLEIYTVYSEGGVNRSFKNRLFTRRTYILSKFLRNFLRVRRDKCF